MNNILHRALSLIVICAALVGALAYFTDKNGISYLDRLSESVFQRNEASGVQIEPTAAQLKNREDALKEIQNPTLQAQ